MFYICLVLKIKLLSFSKNSFCGKWDKRNLYFNTEKQINALWNNTEVNGTIPEMNFTQAVKRKHKCNTEEQKRFHLE